MVIDERTRTGHPVPEQVRALAGGVADLAARPLFGLDQDATRETLLEIADLESRTAALKLSLAAHADQVKVGAETGATSTGAWWAIATQQRRRTTAGLVKLALVVDTRWHGVQTALGGARMNLEQAHVIVRALAESSGRWRTSPTTSTLTSSTGLRSSSWATPRSTTPTSSSGSVRAS